MTFERDPDRLVDAWLDEGPRTFSPRLLEQTLAGIHVTSRQRRGRAPWRFQTMSFPMKTALAGLLLLLVAAGTGGLLPQLPRLLDAPVATATPRATALPTALPSASPGTLPTPDPSPAPTAGTAPEPVLIRGDVPLAGTIWQLIGRIDGQRDPAAADPVYISALDASVAPAAMLMLAEDGTLRGTTGCRSFAGTYQVARRPAGQAAQASVALGALGAPDGVSCAAAVDAQDRELLADLAATGAVQVTSEGYQVLASRLSGADLDLGLDTHFRSYPDLTRLIVRDQSGEGSLIYVPVGPPELQATPEPSFAAGRDPLVGTTWLLDGWLDGETLRAAKDGPVSLTFHPGGLLTGSLGCGLLSGRYEVEPLPDGGPHLTKLGLGSSRLAACDGEGKAQATGVVSAFFMRESWPDGITDTTGAGILDAAGVTVTHELRVRLDASPSVERLVIRDGAGRPTLLLHQRAGTPPSTDPDPTVPFATGDVPVAGTTWVLVGRAVSTPEGDAGVPFVAVGLDRPATLRLSDAGLYVARTGCDDVVGSVAPAPLAADAAVTDGSITFSPQDLGMEPCSEDRLLLDMVLEVLLDDARHYQLTRAPITGGSDAILDPVHTPDALRAHADAWPGIEHLVLRSDRGSPLLIYAPAEEMIPTDADPTGIPTPGAWTATVLGGQRDLVGTTWQLVGVRQDGTVKPLRFTDPATPFRMVVTETAGGNRYRWTATGCPGFAGSSIAGAGRRRGTVDIRIGVDRRELAPGCGDRHGDPDRSVVDAIERHEVKTLRIGQLMPDALGLGQAKTDLDPWLWAYLASRELTPHLVFRDADGVIRLIFSPVEADAAG